MRDVQRRLGTYEDTFTHIVERTKLLSNTLVLCKTDLVLPLRQTSADYIIDKVIGAILCHYTTFRDKNDDSPNCFCPPGQFIWCKQHTIIKENKGNMNSQKWTGIEESHLSFSIIWVIMGVWLLIMWKNHLTILAEFIFSILEYVWTKIEFSFFFNIMGCSTTTFKKWVKTFLFNIMGCSTTTFKRWVKTFLFNIMGCSTTTFKRWVKTFLFNIMGCSTTTFKRWVKTFLFNIMGCSTTTFKRWVKTFLFNIMGCSTTTFKRWVKTFLFNIMGCSTTTFKRWVKTFLFNIMGCSTTTFKRWVKTFLFNIMGCRTSTFRRRVENSVF